MIEQNYHGEVVQCIDRTENYEVRGVQEVLHGTERKKALVIQSLKHIMLYDGERRVMRITYLLWNEAGYFLAYQDVWHEKEHMARTILQSIDTKPIGAYLLNENDNDK